MWKEWCVCVEGLEELGRLVEIQASSVCLRKWLAFVAGQVFLSANVRLQVYILVHSSEKRGVVEL